MRPRDRIDWESEDFYLIQSELKALTNLEWSNASVVAKACRPILQSLAQNKSLLRNLVEHSQTSPLSDLCEHYDILDKLILYSDENDIRLRLHIFADGYFDRPHTHRWPYTTYILSGSYEHSLFEMPENVEEGDPPNLRPVMSRIERTGDSYTLMPGSAHSVQSFGGTVSLIIRGPAVSDRFLVTDRLTGETWWQYGAAKESTEEKERKRMTSAQRQLAVNTLFELGLI